jgi:hypothetical protein
MKNILKSVLLLTSIAFLLPTKNTTAQIQFEDVNTIITAVPFLRIAPDARTGGLGDVGIALSPDAATMWANPSKIAFAEDEMSVAVTYTPWLRQLQLRDVYLAYLSGYYKIDKDQAIGLSMRYFDLGSIQFTNENGDPLQTANPREYEITGTYARKLGEKISAAAGLKFIYSRLAVGTFSGNDYKPGTAVAGDISFTYQDDISISDYDSRLRIGGAITNLGSRIAYTEESENQDYIPTNLGIGAALEMDIDEFNTIGFAVDVNKLLVPTPTDENLDGDDILDYKQLGTAEAIFGSFGDAPGGGSEELSELMFSAGIEYWYNKQFAVRAGYYYEAPTKGNRQYFTAGIGLKYNVFGIDISYLVPTTNINNPLNNTLRFTLVFDLEAFSPDAPVD